MTHKKAAATCAGCGKALGHATALIQVGTRKVQVCGLNRGGGRWSERSPKSACAEKARKKAALCPGCDTEGVSPGTICWSCRELIDRYRGGDDAPTGYLLDVQLLGPYLSAGWNEEEPAHDLLVALCQLAAPKGLRRWASGGCPDWAREIVGSTYRPRFGDGHTGMPAVELDDDQKQALLRIGELLSQVMKAQRLTGVNEGDSVLWRMARGEMSVSDINDYQLRKEKVYSDREDEDD